MAFQLDTNLPLMARAPQMADPMESFSSALQLRSQIEGTRALTEQREAMAEQRRLLADKARREQAEHAALTELFKSGAQTPDAIMSIVGPQRGTEIVKGLQALQTQEVKDYGEVQKVIGQTLGGLLALPEPMRPEAYSTIRQQFVTKGWLRPEQVPEQYAPEFVTMAQQWALSAKEQADIAAGKETRAESKRHNEATEAHQAATLAASQQSDPGSFAAHLDGIAQAKGLKSGRQLDPRTVMQERQRWEAAGRAPAGSNEPLQAIIGPDGKPVLVPRSQAIGKTPASNREIGRQVTSGDAGRLAELETAMDDVRVLSQTLTQTKGATGTAAKVGAMVPNAITELTGWGTGAKQRQATIDRVKQVIGKALEGGVLRKEDELKYEKILPTIADTEAVAQAKIAGLLAALEKRKGRELDSLEHANYDVTRYRAADAPAPPPGAARAGAAPRVDDAAKRAADLIKKYGGGR
jgi:hypothetical protein